MKQNYDRYVFSKKEWILNIVEIAALICGINYLCYR